MSECVGGYQIYGVLFLLIEFGAISWRTTLVTKSVHCIVKYRSEFVLHFLPCADQWINEVQVVCEDLVGQERLTREMTLIEGLGDEVTYALLLLIIVGILTLAWLSTGVRPFNYYVWMVQLQTSPTRRVLQVLQADERAATEIERQVSADGATTTWRVPNSHLTASHSDRPQELDQIADVEFEIHEVNPVRRSSSPVASSNERTRADSQDMESSEASVVDTEQGCITSGNGVGEGGQEEQPEVTGSSSLAEDPHPTGGDTRIRLKFLDDTQKMVAAWLSETVGEFKRQHFMPAVTDGKVVRLIYKGQLLRDDQRSLESYGLHDNCIVHCHVSTTPYQQNQDAGASNPAHSESGDEGVGGIQIGRYIYLIFTIKFAALWFGFAFYPDYFDFASFFSLVMCTLVYVLFAYTTYRARDREPRRLSTRT